MTEDAEIASAVKGYLEALFLNVDVFVSTRDLGGGQVWMKTLHQQLVAAKAIIAIVTRDALASEWIHFESGVGFAEEKTIPLCTDGITPDDLRPPLSLLQARRGDEDGLKRLAADLAHFLGNRAPTEYQGLSKAIEAISSLVGQREEARRVDGPKLDPELEAMATDFLQRFADAIVDVLVEYSSTESAIPGRDDLEQMEISDLQRIAQAYGVRVPPVGFALANLMMSGVPAVDGPHWDKKKTRDDLERALSALDEWDAKRKSPPVKS